MVHPHLLGRHQAGSNRAYHAATLKHLGILNFTLIVRCVLGNGNPDPVGIGQHLFTQAAEEIIPGGALEDLLELGRAIERATVGQLAGRVDSHIERLAFPVA